MGDITRNFDRSEFACRCQCGYDDINILLVNRLQAIRDITGLKMIINSGCRCEKHNREVGGAPDSYHLTGQAADWRFEPASYTWYVMLSRWSGGFHYYEDKGFVHTDVGPKRRWNG